MARSNKVAIVSAVSGIALVTEQEGKFEFPIAKVEAIQEKGLTKADRARIVFADCYKDPINVPARKDIINRLMSEADLTKCGAATYLQNYKTKAGLVKSKAA